MQGDGSICILLPADSHLDLDQHCWLKTLSFIYCVFLAFIKSVYKCVDLHLGLQFNFIDQFVCFYVYTMLIVIVYYH